MQPTPGRQHCLVQLWWKGGGGGGGGGHPYLGSRLTFDPKHAQLGSCLDFELASPWIQHPVGPKRLPCHVLYGAGYCLGRTQSYIQTPPSPMATFDSSGSGCTDAGSWLHPPRPAHSSPMVDCTPYHDGPRFPSLGWTQASISLSPCLRPAPGPDRHCGIGRTGTHHWRYNVSIVWGTPLCASSPTHGGVACAPKWA